MSEIALSAEPDIAEFIQALRTPCHWDHLRMLITAGTLNNQRITPDKLNFLLSAVRRCLQPKVFEREVLARELILHLFKTRPTIVHVENVMIQTLAALQIQRDQSLHRESWRVDIKDVLTQYVEDFKGLINKDLALEALRPDILAIISVHREPSGSSSSLPSTSVGLFLAGASVLICLSYLLFRLT